MRADPFLKLANLTHAFCRLAAILFANSRRMGRYTNRSSKGSCDFPPTLAQDYKRFLVDRTHFYD